MKRILILVILLLISVPTLSGEDPLDVSLVALIANPAVYEGKLVRVKGFLKLEFEGSALYLHRDDYLNGLSKNGLFLEAVPESTSSEAELDSMYVLVVGVFRGSKKGHFDMNSGGITKVRRCDLASDPNYPFALRFKDAIKRKPEKP